MHVIQSTLHRKLAGLSGVLTGVVVGIAAVALAGTAIAQRETDRALGPLVEAAHLPPLLTATGEAVDLRYDVYCTPPSADLVDEPCDAEGTVFVRAGDSGAFHELPLVRDASGGSLSARVPDGLVRSPAGFTYYAVIRSARAGRTITLPAGGAAAPQRSLPLERAVVVDLGRHVFGRARAATARVVETTWGDGPGQVGLEQGRNLTPIGGSSFDVDDVGTVHVLDEANRRLLRWAPGVEMPQDVPLAIDGTLADIAIADDGEIAVLDTAARGGGPEVVRLFGPDGSLRGVVELPERAAAVDEGPGGPVVLQHPSGQWMSVSAQGRGLSRAEQLLSGRAGRPLSGGGEVVVLRRGDELRLALVSASGVRRTWLLSSGTPLAEVQLAQPLGRELLVVVRAYTDGRDEFLVLVLDDRGIAERFAVPSADWAETAPLSRFRLAGTSIYQLGSTPTGLFVDRFDLEVE